MLNKIILLFKLTIAGFMGLVLWQLLSYLWLADYSQAETITQYLPSHKFAYACLSDQTVKSMPASQREHLELLLSNRYDKVYLGAAKIPPQKIRYERAPAPRGRDRRQSPVQKVLLNGIEVDFRVVDAGIMWYKGSYTYYENPQTRKNITAEFIWVLGRWMPINESRNL